MIDERFDRDLRDARLDLDRLLLGWIRRARTAFLILNRIQFHEPWREGRVRGPRRRRGAKLA